LLLLLREDHGEVHGLLLVKLRWWLNHLTVSLTLQDLVCDVADQVVGVIPRFLTGDVIAAVYRHVVLRLILRP
jgi:hypothetical protein